MTKNIDKEIIKFVEGMHTEIITGIHELKEADWKAITNGNSIKSDDVAEAVYNWAKTQSAVTKAIMTKGTVVFYDDIIQFECDLNAIKITDIMHAAYGKFGVKLQSADNNITITLGDIDPSEYAFNVHSSGLNTEVLTQEWNRLVDAEWFFDLIEDRYDFSTTYEYMSKIAEDIIQGTKNWSPEAKAIIASGTFRFDDDRRLVFDMPERIVNGTSYRVKMNMSRCCGDFTIRF